MSVPSSRQLSAESRPHTDRRTGGTAQASDARTRTEGIALRRGMGLLLATLLAPGSAQLAAGNHRVGRLAMRCWLALLVVVALIVMGLVLIRGPVVGLLTTPAVTIILCIGVAAAGFGWALLFIDAWRLSRPPELAQKHRLGYAILVLVLVTSVVALTVGTARTVWAQGSLLSTVFAGGGSSTPQDGRINVLLLGVDDDTGGVGSRPDSMTVASIDAETGRTVMISIPRNLQGAPLPQSSPLKPIYPDGFRCPEEKCMINGLYTEATQVRPGLYPQASDPGVQATREAVEELLGIKINYYAMIDLTGFRDLVDAVGGIRMNFDRRVPVGGGSSKISRYIEPGKAVQLDGDDALWFARSRAGSSDYERMARQKCVMAAMVRQLDAPTVFTRFNALTAAGEDMVRTDIPTDQVDKMITLAEKARGQKISTLALVPPLINPATPDLAAVRVKVQDTITQSEAAEDSARQQDSSPVVGGVGTTSGGSDQNQTDRNHGASQRSGDQRQGQNSLDTKRSGPGNSGADTGGGAESPGNCSPA